MSIAEKLTQIAENEQRVYNAGYEAGKSTGGSSEVIDRSEAFFAENFPSDIWSDGEYVCTFGEISIPVRYKYRADRTDPKDIAIEGTVQDVPEHSVNMSVANLVEYYAICLFCLCGRMAVNSGSDLASILYLNPVVITYADITQFAFSGEVDTYGMVELTAMQASLKNYDGDGDAVNNDTVVSYFCDANIDGLESGDIARYLYAISIPECEWYFEYDYAYGGRCVSARGYLTWEDDV